MTAAAAAESSDARADAVAGGTIVADIVAGAAARESSSFDALKERSERDVLGRWLAGGGGSGPASALHRTRPRCFASTRRLELSLSVHNLLTTRAKGFGETKGNGATGLIAFWAYEMNHSHATLKMQ